VGLNNVLSIATSGLSAAQAALDTISNNVTNANTPGYTRQKINFEANATGTALYGVKFSAPQRVAESFVENSVYLRSGQDGYDSTNDNYLGQLQTNIGSPGSGTSLGATLNGVQAAAIGLTAPGASQQAAAAFIASVNDSLRSFQQLDGDIKQLRLDAESEIAGVIPQINQLLGQIHSLNQQIGGSAVTLRSNTDIDQRNLAVKQLSALVSLTVNDNSDGTVSIKSGNGSVLVDQQLRQLTYSRSFDGGAEAFDAIGIEITSKYGQPGTPTGIMISSSTIGGRLGALLNIRDTELPGVRDDLADLAIGLATALNKAGNKASPAPALQTLTGRNTGLLTTDRLNFTGNTTIAITDANGRLVSKSTIDLGGLGPNATIQSLVDRINTDINVAPSFTVASFSRGVLTLSSGTSAYGVSIADDASSPAARSGAGFSQFFGMNDLLRSDTTQLIATGLTASEPHNLTGTADVVLSDPNGRILARQTIDFAALTGPKIQDVLDALGSGPLGALGAFGLDSAGQFKFTPVSTALGTRLTVPNDVSIRGDTGVTFGALTGFSKAAKAPANLFMRKDLSLNPTRLPSSVLDPSVSAGSVALGNQDRSGFGNYLVELDSPVKVGTAVPAKLQDALAATISEAALRASAASRQSESSAARLADAVKRRDSVSGVNIDEELAQLVAFQNSYAAAARVISTTSQMYDTLLSIAR
jgi:flagellar hook-associated protein 1 FlgK